MAYKGSGGLPRVAQDRVHIGGINPATLTGTLTLDGASSNYQLLDPGGASRTVTLPAETGFTNGVFFVSNNASDAGELLNVRNDAGTLILALDKGETGLYACDGTNWYGLPMGVPPTGARQPDLIFDAATELTIDAAGLITVTQGYHDVDTNADGASDNLDTISGLADGEVLILRAENAARTVVIRDFSVAGGAGNIYTPGQQSISLAEATDWAMFVGDGTNAVVVAFRTQALAGGGLGAALASTSASLGASLVGIQDSASLIAAATVEGALAEFAPKVAATIADPGNGLAIPVTVSGVCNLTTGGGGETRTLAIPTRVGQRIGLNFDVDGGGDCVITVASAFNQDGDTVITLNDAGDYVELVGVNIAGALRWREVSDVERVDANLGVLDGQVAALGAENTDGLQLIPIQGGVATAGTWTAAMDANGIYTLTRTAGAATEYFWCPIPVPHRSTASKGIKPTGADINYSVATADATDITFEVWKRTLGANGASPTAAVLFGEDDADYDVDHNTAAKRGLDTANPQLHRAIITDAGAPAYLGAGESLWLRIKVVDPGTSDVVIRAAQLRFAETLVDLA